MSMEPIQRRMTRGAAGTINVQRLLLDDITGLTFIQLSIPNTILDIYNDPTAPATVRYTNELFKNSISTGRNFFTSAMDTSSAGRAAIGPIKIAPGQLQMGSTQTVGTAVNDNNIVIKFANGF